MMAYVNATTTFACHLALLESEPTQQLVDPFESIAAGIHTIRTRSSMFVSYDLVTVFLGKDYTTVEAFQLANPLLEEEGLEAVCAPFLTFLQLASNAPTTDNPRPVTLQDEVDLPCRVTHPGVVPNRLESVIYHFLPDLRPSSATVPDAFATSMSAGLTHIAVDHCVRETRAVKSARKKMFRDKYGEGIADGILLLTGAVDDDLLPPLGHQKGESERVILQRKVGQSAEVLGVLPFNITPSQSIALKTFDCCGLLVGEICTGVLSLSIIPPDATSAAAVRSTAGNHANAEIYDLSGDPSGGAMSIVDTQHLQNQKGYIPDNWGEARVQLRCTLGLLGALCGDSHGVTMAWGAMLCRFERMESRLQHQLDL
jgi:hypothetical protein